MKRITALILMVMLLMTCFSANVFADDAKRDDVIIRVESPWSTFNPLDSSLYVEFYELNQLYDTLVWVNDAGEIVPELAESWSSNEAGNEYIIKLREGVKFHNGDELKASDVAFVLTKASESAALKSNLGAFVSAEAISDYEVKLVLEAPFAPLISFLANIKIFNQRFYEENNGDMRTVECGTGPYMMVDVDMDSEMNVVAFPDYWKGEAAIKNVKFKVITDDTTAAVAYRAGEVDFVSTSASQYMEISQNPDLYSFKALATKHTALIYFNSEREPFTNKEVRKALQHAVDRDVLIMVAFEGYAEPAYLQGNESCFGIDYDYCVDYEYNPELAKQMLADAGYPNGLDLGTIVTTPGSYMAKCAVAWQAMLADIGCTCEISQLENTTLTAVCLSGDYDMMTGGQSFSTDFAYAAKQYCSEYIGSNNYSRLRNDRVDEIFKLAEVESDPEARKQLYGEAIHIITDEATMIPMFHKQLMFVWTKGLDVTVHGDSYVPYFVYDWSWE